MIDFTNVNYQVIILAGVLNMGLGMLWYGPLFGNKWMAGMGYTEEDRASMHKGAGPAYVATLVLALGYGYVMDLVINTMAPVSLMGALAIGLLVWVGFSVSSTAKSLLWGETDRTVYVINTIFELIFAIIMSLVAFSL